MPLLGSSVSTKATKSFPKYTNIRMIPSTERQTGSHVHVPVFVGVSPHFCRDQFCQASRLNMLKRILQAAATTTMPFPIMQHSLWGTTFSHSGLEWCHGWRASSIEPNTQIVCADIRRLHHNPVKAVLPASLFHHQVFRLDQDQNKERVSSKDQPLL